MILVDTAEKICEFLPVVGELLPGAVAVAVVDEVSTIRSIRPPHAPR